MGVMITKNLKHKTQKFYFFALAPTGEGISGSDRIFIELAREWSKKISVTIFTTIEGVKMMESQNLSGKYLEIKNITNKLPDSFFLKYIYKIYLGIKLGFSSSLTSTIYNLQSTYIYSSSDFWMDVFPGIILKIRFKKLKWIATWYQTAPNPLKGFAEGNRGKKYRLNALIYWLSQLPVKSLINKFADKVIVNNIDEKKRFPEMDKKEKVLVLIGAVRLDDIKNFLSTSYHLLSTKKYDCVFQGRFHPQKGVIELIDIWRKVVDEIPNAKLALIGDGPLMQNVRSKIQDLRLEKNVRLFGYLFDGPKKYEIFSKSKVVAHPAFYDSGGMASAEAMAFGLPAIGFDLKSYESYYPKGIIKVEIGNVEKFAQELIKVIKDSKNRIKLGGEAREMVESNWSWKNRANSLLINITKSL